MPKRLIVGAGIAAIVLGFAIIGMGIAQLMGQHERELRQQASRSRPSSCNWLKSQIDQLKAQTRSALLATRSLAHFLGQIDPRLGQFQKSRLIRPQGGMLRQSHRLRRVLKVVVLRGCGDPALLSATWAGVFARF
jgi:hypothetical protein